MAVKRIGVLTGGGDAPGLNPAIRALVWKAAESGIEAVGIYDGWLAPLGAGGRGDGAARGASGAVVGARRRRVHHADSGGAVRDREGVEAARRAAVEGQKRSAAAALRGGGGGRGRAAVGRRRD